VRDRHLRIPIQSRRTLLLPRLPWVVDEHDGWRLRGAGGDEDGLPGPEALDARGVDLELVAAAARALPARASREQAILGLLG
jgi:hypothetical protein